MDDYWFACWMFFLFQLCDTYPRILYVPSSASTPVLVGSSKFRSRGRLPILSYVYRNKVPFTTVSILFLPVTWIFGIYKPFVCFSRLQYVDVASPLWDSVLGVWKMSICSIVSFTPIPMQTSCMLLTHDRRSVLLEGNSWMHYPCLT